MSARRLLFTGAAIPTDVKDAAIKFLSSSLLICVGGIGGYAVKSVVDLGDKVHKLETDSAVQGQQLSALLTDVTEIKKDVVSIKESLNAIKFKLHIKP